MSQSRITGAFFVEGFLLFSLGVGIAKYLGSTIAWERVWLGILWVGCLQVGASFLWRQALRISKDADNGQLRSSSFSSEFSLASASFACLASLTVLMIAGRFFNLPLFLISVIGVLGTLVSTKAIRIGELDRFREVIISFLMAVLIPWFSFLLQTGELHRFLTFVALPMLALRIAMILSYQLSTYANDVHQKNQTLMVRIGWQSGMSLHNVLILFAFVVIAFGPLLGIPMAVGLPPLAALVLGLWQIWLMRRIAQGVKPNWRGLVWGGAAMYGLVVYLFSYSFWIR